MSDVSKTSAELVAQLRNLAIEVPALNDAGLLMEAAARIVAMNATAAIERVRDEARSVVIGENEPRNDWNMALDYLAKRILAVLDGAPEPELSETGLEVRDSDGDLVASGEHRRVLHQKTYVCDTCVNSIGLNVRWDRADRMDGHPLPVEGESNGE